MIFFDCLEIKGQDYIGLTPYKEGDECCENTITCVTAVTAKIQASSQRGSPVISTNQKREIADSASPASAWRLGIW